MSTRASAQTYVWTGAASTHWGTAGNWDLGLVPVTNCDLVFGQAGMVNLPTNNLFPGASLLNSITFNNNLGGPLTVAGQGIATNGGGITTTSTSMVTLNYNNQMGASQNWSTVGSGGLTIQRLSFNSASSTLSWGTAATQNNASIFLTGDATGIGYNGLASNFQTVTLWHNITLTNSQRWDVTNYQITTNVNSNLTAGSAVVLTLNDNDGIAPAFRFGGNNTNFLGDLTTTTAAGSIKLETPGSMIAGRILINADSRILGLQGATGSATPPTYTFDYYASASSPPATPAHGRGIVVFRGASGTGGLYASGTTRWDPGNGADYVTGTLTSANSVHLATPTQTAFFGGYTIRFGNTSSNFILRSDFTVQSSGTGASPFIIDYALTDDGSTRNLFVVNGLVGLTRARATSNSLTSTPALDGSTLVQNNGILSISGADRLFTGPLLLNGGILVFENMTWASFAATRTEGSGNNQYSLFSGGIAARGSNITVSSASTSSNTFDKSFSLGTNKTWLLDGNTTTYANAGVTIDRSTTLTAQRTITAYSEGPGLTGNTGTGFVHGINGLTDNGVTKGAVVFRTAANSFFANQATEIVLGGTNNWTGSAGVTSNGAIFNTGPGGLISVDGTLLIRFADPGSIPSGNAGANAYLAALRNNGSTFSSQSGWHGFLFTGTSSGQTFTLPTGVKMVIGGIGTAGTNTMDGILGSTGGNATLAQAPVYIHAGTSTENARNLYALVRDGTFTWGTGSATTDAVTFVATLGSDTVLGGINGTATPVTNRTSFTTIIKNGPGMLILQNVKYTNLAGSGAFGGGFSQSLTWSVDQGIVRDNLTGLANFGTASITLGTTIEGFGNMVRPMGFTTNTLTWSSGGFAAFGGVFNINVGGNVTPTTLMWGASRFLQGVGGPANMTLSSANADSIVTLFNPIDLNASTATTVRQVTVLDNPATNADYAVLAGDISGIPQLTKLGAGRLDLAGANNTFSGNLNVAAGRLNVTGTLAAAAGVVNVRDGELGGTGTINRNVNLLTNASINPGTTSIGTLTVNGNVAFNTIGTGSSFAARLGSASSADQLVVNGTVNLNNAILLTTLNYVPAASDKFFIMTNDGTDAITGTFNGITNGQMITLTFNSINYNVWVYYNADFGSSSFTGGNDVLVSFSPVPEPALVLLACGVAVVGFRRKIVK